MAGRLADWDVNRSIIGSFVASIATLLLVVWLSPYVAAAVFLVFAVGVLGSVLAINLRCG